MYFILIVKNKENNISKSYPNFELIDFQNSYPPMPDINKYNLPYDKPPTLKPPKNLLSPIKNKEAEYDREWNISFLIIISK